MRRTAKKGAAADMYPSQARALRHVGAAIGQLRSETVDIWLQGGGVRFNCQRCNLKIAVVASTAGLCVIPAKLLTTAVQHSAIVNLNFIRLRRRVITSAVPDLSQTE
jgi:hypothetical protein